MKNVGSTLMLLGIVLFTFIVVVGAIMYNGYGWWANQQGCERVWEATQLRHPPSERTPLPEYCAALQTEVKYMAGMLIVSVFLIGIGFGIKKMAPDFPTNDNDPLGIR